MMGRYKITSLLFRHLVREQRSGVVSCKGVSREVRAGSHAAGQRIAMMYSFFTTCKANDVNPQLWLTHVLDNIKETKLSELSSLLPQNVDL